MLLPGGSLGPQTRKPVKIVIMDERLITPMPIPFLEALRGRLAPVFNGTVPLEREKESITNGAWQACQGPDGTAGTDTRARHKYLHLHKQNTACGLKVEADILNMFSQLLRCCERGEMGSRAGIVEVKVINL